VAYPVRLVSGAWKVKTVQGEGFCLDQNPLYD
jgi:hypothetical protein